jgi:hypothetical protein
MRAMTEDDDRDTGCSKATAALVWAYVILGVLGLLLGIPA